MVFTGVWHPEAVPGSAVIRLVCDRLPLCATCKQGQLIYRDSVRRISRKKGGAIRWYERPRGRCTVCHSIHRVLPVVLGPYKHYMEEMISQILCGTLSKEDEALVDYPCDMTKGRWRFWKRDGFRTLPDHAPYSWFVR